MKIHLIRLSNLSVRLFWRCSGTGFTGSSASAHEVNMLLVLIWVVHRLQQWADRGFQLIAITQFEYMSVCVLSQDYTAMMLNHMNVRYLQILEMRNIIQ